MGYNTTNKSNINANHIIPSTNTSDAECLAKNKILYFHINWVISQKAFDVCKLYMQPTCHSNSHFLLILLSCNLNVVIKNTDVLLVDMTFITNTRL